MFTSYLAFPAVSLRGAPSQKGSAPPVTAALAIPPRWGEPFVSGQNDACFERGGVYCRTQGRRRSWTLAAASVACCSAQMWQLVAWTSRPSPTSCSSIPREKPQSKPGCQQLQAHIVLLLLPKRCKTLVTICMMLASAFPLLE